MPVSKTHGTILQGAIEPRSATLGGRSQCAPVVLDLLTTHLKSEFRYLNNHHSGVGYTIATTVYSRSDTETLIVSMFGPCLSG